MRNISPLRLALAPLLVVFVVACDVETPPEPATATDAPDGADAPGPGDPADPSEPEPTDPTNPTEPTEPSEPTNPTDPSPPAAASTGCGSATPADGVWTLSHDGAERSFVVRLPPGADNETPLPVVFSFHGRAVNASAQELTSGFTELGASEGFVVVYPEGLGALQTWNAGVCCGNGTSSADDVGFFDAMLERLEQDLCIDASRVYANGLSAGAFMTYGLACERSEKLAGVAAVAGATGILSCDPAAPLPVLHFHGTGDNVVPYDGNFGFTFLGAPNNATAWAERNGCADDSSMYLEAGDVTCEAWSGCDASADVRLCTIAGGGHQWPGGPTAPGFGDNTDAISATQMMWEFFAAHSR